MYKKIVAILSTVLAASAFSSTAVTASAAEAASNTGNKITLYISDAGNNAVMNAKYMLAEYTTSKGSMSATALGYFTFTGGIGQAVSGGKSGTWGVYTFDDSNILRYAENKNKSIEKGKSYAVICVETNNNGYPTITKITTSKSKADTSVNLVEPKWGDLDFDGDVDGNDLLIMQKAKELNYGITVPSNLPESWKKKYCNGSSRISLRTFLSEPKLMAWKFYSKFDKNLTEEKFKSTYFEGTNSLGTFSYADVNGDHKINDKDLKLIERYASGWKVTLGKSKIKLN